MEPHELKPLPRLLGKAGVVSCKGEMKFYHYLFLLSTHSYGQKANIKACRRAKSHLHNNLF
jgi:hypothetical protein